MSAIPPFIAALPKAELHMHLEGSLEPETLLAMAQRNGVRLPYADADHLRRAYAFDGLASFLDLYYLGLTVLQTGDDFYQMTQAYLARAARENVRHAEVFISPQAHLRRGLPLAVMIESILAAFEAAHHLHGIRVFPDMASHNIRKLHEAGLCITVNSDDPPYFGGYINRNYAAIQSALGLADEDLWQMARNSFIAAYLSDELRRRYLSELDGYRPRPEIP